jgi:hypothetical protein
VIEFEVDAFTTQIALVLLSLSLVFTLVKVKKRLFVSKPLRFYGVAGLNVIAVLTLAAWLSNLSIRHPFEQSAVLDTEQHGDPSVVLLNHPNLTSLTVKGYGLRAAQWSPFAGVELEHQPPVLKAGPIELNWGRQLLLGDSFTIAGRYQNSSTDLNENTNGIVTVKLLDPAGTVVAQTRIKNHQTFQLSGTPKAMGHYVYRLNVVSEKNELLNDEVIPLVVSKAPAAKLLVVQSAPSFESKHLKNWASSQGASLLILTTISKEKYITHSVNMAEDAPRQFTPQLLNDFDLLIMDGRALANLSNVHQQWLNLAVDQGLGLYVMADDDLIKATPLPSIISSFSFEPITSLKIGPSLTRPSWLGNHGELMFDLMAYKIAAEQGELLLSGSKKRQLSILKSIGKGKVAVSILKGRYRWLLNGDLQTYSHYWQRLLSRMARIRSDSRFITQVKNELGVTNIRSEICVLSDKLGLKLSANDKALNLSLHLNPDSFNPYRHCAFYWPQQAGWQRFVLSDVDGNELDTTARYTFSPQQWQSWQQSRRLDDTADFISEHKQRVQNPKAARLTAQDYDYLPLNLLWYWWLLVICGGLLWVERKVG